MLLHHIGIVVPSIESAVEGFCHSLSRRWDGHYPRPIAEGLRHFPELLEQPARAFDRTC